MNGQKSLNTALFYSWGAIKKGDLIMDKYTLDEIKKGQGCFTGGGITMVGEVISSDDPRRYITYDVSDRAGQDIELIGTTRLNKSGTATLVLI
jgi:hypothetical protein